MRHVSHALIPPSRQAVTRGEKVLACAASNVAVDNLAERLLPTQVINKTIRRDEQNNSPRLTKQFAEMNETIRRVLVVPQKPLSKKEARAAARAATGGAPSDSNSDNNSSANSFVHLGSDAGGALRIVRVGEPSLPPLQASRLLLSFYTWHATE